MNLIVKTLSIQTTTAATKRIKSSKRKKKQDTNKETHQTESGTFSVPETTDYSR